MPNRNTFDTANSSKLTVEVRLRARKIEQEIGRNWNLFKKIALVGRKILVYYIIDEFKETSLWFKSFLVGFCLCMHFIHRIRESVAYFFHYNHKSFFYS